MSKKIQVEEKYIAYEKINKYSPVFSFYCEKNKINYVYVSQNLIKMDNGNPLCIGICINKVKKNESAKIIQNGIIKVRYFGESIPNNTARNIYLANNYNDLKLNGFSTQLNKDIVPYSYSGAFLIKLGTSIPTKSKIDGDVKKRVITILVDINNVNYDLYNIYLLSLLSKDNIDGQPFSFYNIGVDLDAGVKNPSVKDKFQQLLTAYSTNQNVDKICLSLDQYCKELYKNIPNPSFTGYSKRLIAINSSGQCIFDSDYSTLGIYDYTKNMAYKIKLITNPFKKSEFLTFATLINSPLLAYVDPNDPANDKFIGSSFTYPAGTLYEFAQASINGVGVSARYTVSNELYNYNVALFIALTNSFNVNNGESLIVRLSWKKI